MTENGEIFCDTAALIKPHEVPSAENHHRWRLSYRICAGAILCAGFVPCAGAFNEYLDGFAFLGEWIEIFPDREDPYWIGILIFNVIVKLW